VLLERTTREVNRRPWEMREVRETRDMIEGMREGSSEVVRD